MNIKRMRGRGGHRNNSGPPRPQSGGGANGGIPLNPNHVFDSIGPGLRVRGTAQQLFEKYLQLGRDATSSGDRVAAEGYFQHAEHYFRILNAMNQAQQVQQGSGQPGGQPGGPANGQGGYPSRRYNGDDAPQAGADASAAIEAELAATAPGTGEQPDPRDIPITLGPES
ncbi:MAG: DUF4167 domain-containing protein [Acetobacteraceae bacterium]